MSGINRGRIIWWSVLAVLLAAGVIPAFFSPPESVDEKKQLQRIVSLAPNITEILFELGVGDQVVGVTRFCDHPAEVSALTKIGGYIDPNVEVIVGLKPNLVIGLEEARNEALSSRMEDLGVPMLTVSTEDLEGLRRAVSSIAENTDSSEVGRTLNARLSQQYQDVKARVKEGGRPRVLVVMGHQPLVVAGGGVFADELIRLAGGVNVAGDNDVPYPVWSLEHVVLAAPDVIIEAGMEPGTEIVWADWESIPAVERNRVVRAEEPHMLLRAGPRIGEGLLWLVGVLHPKDSD